MKAGGNSIIGKWLEKKYGLFWDIDKEDVVEKCKTEYPYLKELKNKEIKINKNLTTNILIEGDNYHSVSVLNITHKEKIDVIYIDPPYNTGAKNWKYNILSSGSYYNRVSQKYFTDLTTLEQSTSSNEPSITEIQTYFYVWMFWF